MNHEYINSKYPNEDGYFGEFGGKFIPETLMYAINDLTREYEIAKDDVGYRSELESLLNDYCGRETPLYFAERLSDYLASGSKDNKPRVYLKREDLLHTGAHKINNAIGQILLARRIGKKRVIAETGAGQHGVATASVAARFGMECVIYMGKVDMERQALNVARMKMLGAEVREVRSGQMTLKEAVSEAMRDWVASVNDTHYILGSALGSHPFPMMVRDFHKIIGEETRYQILKKEKRLPTYLIACVGGGSNAMGLFYDFLNEKDIKMIGVEAGGDGIISGRHAARFQGGKLGVLQGTKTYLLCDDDGQIELTHSISAGLDYPAVGPEHSFLKKTKRVTYDYATDKEALEAFSTLSRLEGILPALESSHAIAYLLKNKDKFTKDDIIVLNLSGRGDKDVDQVAKYLL